MKKAYISPKVKTVALQLENAALAALSKTDVTDGVTGGDFIDGPDISGEEGTGEDL